MFAAEVNSSLQSYSSRNTNGVGSNGFGILHTLEISGR